MLWRPSSFVASQFRIHPPRTLSQSLRGVFPRGFTLVEVVVAAAILVILLIALMGSFSAGVTGFKQAQQLTFAQNLAEFQAEDLKALAPSVLKLLCEGTWTGVPPRVDPTLTNYPAALSSDPDNALACNQRPFEYDSGQRQTDFNIILIDAVVAGTTPLVYQAGGMSEPTLDFDPPLLLGSNVSVGNCSQTDPTDDPRYYYVVKMHKEAYPLFTKQIRVVCYSALMPVTVDPWNPSIAPEYHFLSAPYAAQTNMDRYYADGGGHQRAMYAYVITIRYKQGTTSRVLYETRGVISAPYS
jgi:prepilin-type N-terminal cleavage/methylation domain-containing protein